MAKGRSVYLTASEYHFVSTALDLARGCGELDDQLPHHEGKIDLKKLLEKFDVYLPDDADAVR